MDFNEQLAAYQKELQKLVPTKRQEAEITNAGAKVLKDAYYDATKDKHYDASREVGKMKHLADTVTSVNTDIDGDQTGASTVGFEVTPQNHARIARFLNNGTRYIKGDHFIDQAITDHKDETLLVQAEMYRKLTGGD